MKNILIFLLIFSQVAFGANKIMNRDIDPNAEIARSKIASGDANEIVINDSAGDFASITPSELTDDLDPFTGDSGSGGAQGVVPAPSAGDAAAGKFLSADGNWQVPSGGGGGSTTLTGDVTGTGTGTVATTIANDAVTDAKLRDSAALSVIGRSANSTGNPADIAAGSDHNVMRRSGTSIGFGTIDLAQAGTVGSSILGVPNGGTGAATFTANLPLIGNGTGAIAQGTRSGNTTTYGTTSGSLTNGNCAEFDANGNIVDSGSACGGGASGSFDYVGHCRNPQTANCEASRSSQNSYGDLVDADCTACSSTNISGGVTAPGSNTLGVVFTAQASTSKRYLIKVNGYLTNGSSGVSCGWRMTDGTDISDIAYTPNSQDAGNATLWFIIGFTSGGSKTVKIQTTGISASGGCGIQMGQTGKELRFDVFEIDPP